ncbi:MAG: metal-dependent transcriptional regulator [Crocinitomicaceae bacterium]|nr:metal-dependent transcriptional regulator [Crocinitomicaceae bacterium]
MNILSHSEENYLKHIYHIAGKERNKVATNSLAERLETKASSITDMLKKLKEKELIEYEKYKGCGLTDLGENIAIQIIRKHRIWETFLVNELNFKWDEVHDIAEQLEHIQSQELIDRIDAFLGFPKFDPHGDPIPNKQGKIEYRELKINLSEAKEDVNYEIVSVNEDSLALLRYLDDNKIGLGSEILILERYDFDNSLKVKIKGKKTINLSEKVTSCIGVRPM